MNNLNSNCLWFIILIVLLLCCGGCSGCSGNNNFMPHPPCCND